MLATTSSRSLPRRAVHALARSLPSLSSGYLNPPLLLSSSSCSSSTITTITSTSTSSLSPTTSPLLNTRRPFSSYAASLFQSTSANMVVNKINSLAEYKELVLEKQDGVLKVIDSFAEWCPPCKAIAPVLEKLSEQYTEVNFYKIDVDAVPDVAQELGVRAMPTFAFFKNGNKVDEVVGANPPAIEKSIKEFK